MHYDYRKLVRKRMLLGWSQGDVAKKIEETFGEADAITQSTVCHVETGKNQSPPTVMKIASVLGVEMEDILVDNEPTKAKTRPRPTGNGKRKELTGARK